MHLEPISRCAPEITTKLPPIQRQSHALLLSYVSAVNYDVTVMLTFHHMKRSSLHQFILLDTVWNLVIISIRGHSDLWPPNSNQLIVASEWTVANGEKVWLCGGNTWNETVLLISLVPLTHGAPSHFNGLHEYSNVNWAHLLQPQGVQTKVRLTQPLSGLHPEEMLHTWLHFFFFFFKSHSCQLKEHKWMIWRSKSIFVPDISVVQQLPSISPCSHLLPVTGTQDVIFMTSCPRTPIACCSRLLYLVGLQFICITGKPLNQVMRHHVAWAAGERWVSWTSVLELLPLPNAIHCPALPKTGSGQWRHHHHRILSAPELHPSSFCQSLPASFIWRSPELRSSCKLKWTTIESRAYVLDQVGLTSPTRNCCAWDSFGLSSSILSQHRCNNRHPSSAAD